MSTPRRPTSTSTFGVGRRESHDARDFYARFQAPTISPDDTVNRAGALDQIVIGDARRMGELDPGIEPASVALVVTSPPYFAGKEYEEALGQGHVPGSYLEYLQMLHDVFAACLDGLEPGGRVAVNVANLGRKPYRSLAGDVVRILEYDLGLLLRGEIVWRKAKGSTGSCAWGSFQSAANPVLRDLTERIVVASKGRFDRALPRAVRRRLGLPCQDTIYKEDFLSWTTDVWDIPAASATRVGHPAPFPVELPRRLIELYTYRDDLVLDPFMGSGSTAVAAVETYRHYFGYDTDPDYVAAARRRADEALRQRDRRQAPATLDFDIDEHWRWVRPDSDSPEHPVGGDSGTRMDRAVSEALRSGQAAKELVRTLLDHAGFTEVAVPSRRSGGAPATFSARDRVGGRWLFDLAGSVSKGSDDQGLSRAETVWRVIGQAAVRREAEPEPFHLVLLTTALPRKGSDGARALAWAGQAGLVFEVIELDRAESRRRLVDFASGRSSGRPTASRPGRR